MHKLVLVVYLTLVLAVAGVAVDSHKQSPSQPDKPQIRDSSGRDESVPHSATERVAHGRFEELENEDDAHLAGEASNER